MYKFIYYRENLARQAESFVFYLAKVFHNITITYNPYAQFYCYYCTMLSLKTSLKRTTRMVIQKQYTYIKKTSIIRRSTRRPSPLYGHMGAVKRVFTTKGCPDTAQGNYTVILNCQSGGWGGCSLTPSHHHSLLVSVVVGSGLFVRVVVGIVWSVYVTISYFNKSK